jgi:oxygen-independent coproporphyrinogen-3 oxidase
VPTTNPDPFRGLYVHVPFCLSKCPYCAFASAPWGRRSSLRERFVRAVLCQAAAPRGTVFDTLYFGGGTPSALGPDRLGRLLVGLREAVTVAPGAEVTVEANPGDVTPGLIRELLGAGMTRLSLGVQSFHDSDLRVLGRRHDADGARKALEMARHNGVTNLGLDLIYGLPGQTAAAWAAVVDEAIAAAPEHVSMYALTLEEGTPLAASVQEGRVAAPTDRVLLNRFLAASERFEAAGYEHYEVSNLARPGHRSRHNSRYWSRAPYLGLGPSAHSFDGARRWWNVRDVDAWLANVEDGGDGVAETETLTPEQARLEQIALGLRTADGLDATLVQGDDAWASARAFERAGWLTVVDGRLKPTRAGLFVADGMARRLA